MNTIPCRSCEAVVKITYKKALYANGTLATYWECQCEACGSKWGNKEKIRAMVDWYKNSVIPMPVVILEETSV